MNRTDDAPRVDLTDVRDSVERMRPAFDQLARNLGEAVARLQPQFVALTAALNRAFGSVQTLTRTTEAKLLYYRRCEFGGNAYDAHKWPGEWQSVQCAAWLPDCPSDEHDLRCTGARHSR